VIGGTKWDLREAEFVKVHDTKYMPTGGERKNKMQKSVKEVQDMLVVSWESHEDAPKQCEEV
jgi:hypothetical protein